MALRKVLSPRLSGVGMTESELELRFLDLVRRQGLPEPLVQGTPAWLPNPAGRVDFSYPSATLVVEVDGSWHLTAEQKETDTRRDHAAILQGWSVLRFTWRQVVHDASYVAGVLRGALGRGG